MADETHATGGTSDDMLNAIIQQLLDRQTSGGNTFSDVGQVLGNAAAGHAAGVGAENTTALGAGALSNNLFQSAMQRAMAQAALPNFRAQQAVTGDQIANTQDVVPTGPANVMSHVINFTGGRRPSNLGPNARAAGAALSNIGASQIGKDELPAVPNMPKMSTGGVLGNILGGGSLASSLLGALAGGGGKNGGSFDIGKLLSGLKRGNPSNPYGSTTISGRDPFGTNLPGFDWLGENATTGTNPTQDPSGGTGVGPGMASYYEWLRQQQNEDGGASATLTDNWGDE